MTKELDAIVVFDDDGNLGLVTDDPVEVERKTEEAYRNHRCTSCGTRTCETQRAPMLVDETWAKLAEKREDLCRDCLFKRAAQRRVTLGPADLLDCPFNFGLRREELSATILMEMALDLLRK